MNNDDLTDLIFTISPPETPCISFAEITNKRMIRFGSGKSARKRKVSVARAKFKCFKFRLHEWAMS